MGITYGEERKEFPQDIVITHKLASYYGWDWYQIWGDEKRDIPACPYPKLLELLQYITYLENHQSEFCCPAEIGNFKNLVRQYGSKDEKD